MRNTEVDQRGSWMQRLLFLKLWSQEGSGTLWSQGHFLRLKIRTCGFNVYIVNENIIKEINALRKSSYQFLQKAKPPLEIHRLGIAVPHRITLVFNHTQQLHQGLPA